MLVLLKNTFSFTKNRFTIPVIGSRRVWDYKTPLSRGLTVYFKIGPY